MRQSPSISLVLKTAWRLFLARGWLFIAVLILSGLPPQLYRISTQAGWLPNFVPELMALAGPSPSVREDGWLSFVLYAHAKTSIGATAFILMFGWVHALAIILYTKIAVEWQAGQKLRALRLPRHLIPAMFIVWMVLIIITVSTGLGTTLFVIPGLLISALLYVATFVAADEKVGPFTALTRSFALTRGFLGGILVIMLFLALPSFAWGFFETTVILPRILDAGGGIEDWLDDRLAIRFVLSWVGKIASTVIAVSAYLVLKRAETGPGDQEVSDVFV